MSQPCFSSSSKSCECGDSVVWKWRCYPVVEQLGQNCHVDLQCDPLQSKQRICHPWLKTCVCKFGFEPDELDRCVNMSKASETQTAEMAGMADFEQLDFMEGDFESFHPKPLLPVNLVPVDIKMQHHYHGHRAVQALDNENDNHSWMPKDKQVPLLAVSALVLVLALVLAFALGARRVSRRMKSKKRLLRNMAAASKYGVQENSCSNSCDTVVVVGEDNNNNANAMQGDGKRGRRQSVIQLPPLDPENPKATSSSSGSPAALSPLPPIGQQGQEGQE